MVSQLIQNEEDFKDCILGLSQVFLFKNSFSLITPIKKNELDLELIILMQLLYFAVVQLSGVLPYSDLQLMWQPMDSAMD